MGIQLYDATKGAKFITFGNEFPPIHEWVSYTVAYSYSHPGDGGGQVSIYMNGVLQTFNCTCNTTTYCDDPIKSQDHCVAGSNAVIGVDYSGVHDLKIEDNRYLRRPQDAPPATPT